MIAPADTVERQRMSPASVAHAAASYQGAIRWERYGWAAGLSALCTCWRW